MPTRGRVSKQEREILRLERIGTVVRGEAKEAVAGDGLSLVFGELELLYDGVNLLRKLGALCDRYWL